MLSNYIGYNIASSTYEAAVNYSINNKLYCFASDNATNNNCCFINTIAAKPYLEHVTIDN